MTKSQLGLATHFGNEGVFYAGEKFSCSFTFQHRSGAGGGGPGAGGGGGTTATIGGSTGFYAAAAATAATATTTAFSAAAQTPVTPFMRKGGRPRIASLREMALASPEIRDILPTALLSTIPSDESVAAAMGGGGATGGGDGARTGNMKHHHDSISDIPTLGGAGGDEDAMGLRGSSASSRRTGPSQPRPTPPSPSRSPSPSSPSPSPPPRVAVHPAVSVSSEREEPPRRPVSGETPPPPRLQHHADHQEHQPRKEEDANDDHNDHNDNDDERDELIIKASVISDRLGSAKPLLENRGGLLAWFWPFSSATAGDEEADPLSSSSSALSRSVTASPGLAVDQSPVVKNMEASSTNTMMYADQQRPASAASNVGISQGSGGGIALSNSGGIVLTEQSPVASSESATLSKPGGRPPLYPNKKSAEGVQQDARKTSLLRHESYSSEAKEQRERELKRQPSESFQVIAVESSATRSSRMSVSSLDGRGLRSSMSMDLSSSLSRGRQDSFSSLGGRSEHSPVPNHHPLRLDISVATAPPQELALAFIQLIGYYTVDPALVKSSEDADDLRTLLNTPSGAGVSMEEVYSKLRGG